MTPKIEIGVGEIDPPNVIEAKNRFREGPVGRSLLEAIQRISELIGEIPLLIFLFLESYDFLLIKLIYFLIQFLYSNSLAVISNFH
jgi:hypothetical protein